jgi:hypothetical protein
MVQELLTDPVAKGLYCGKWHGNLPAPRVR